MKTLIDEVMYQAHINGECEMGCTYCLMEDELNEEHEFIEQKNSKKASNSKNEKALKKQ